MPAVRRSALLSAFWKIHKWVYAWSGGRLGSSVMGIKIICLTTIGRKSGQPRSVMLYAFQAEADPVVVASNAGDDSHPLWFLNLKANPNVSVDSSGSQFSAIARVVQGDERERFWAQAVEAEPGYAEYQARLERQIPVVILERQAEDASQSEPAANSIEGGP